MPPARRVILLLLPFAGYDRGLLEGIARYSQVHGPWEFYLSGDYPDVPLPLSESLSGNLAGLEYLSGSMGNMTLPNLRSWGATGIIGRIQTPALARRISATGLPVIWLDLSAEQLARTKPAVSEIRADSHTAGRLAADHFLERGFRHFGFCGYSGRLWSNRRQEGFCDRLHEAGLVCSVYEPPSRKRGLPWNLEQSNVIAWLQSLPSPMAIMACNDNRGRQIMEAGRSVGMHIPDDLAVVGVDNDEMLCNLCNPPLSSVAFNLESSGYRAAEFLDALMDNPTLPPRQIVAESRWVISRRSTDVFAIKDPHVAAALRFIRSHSETSFLIDDVVAQTNISRRGLEIRFQQFLGRSIRQEIQRVRLARTKQLLAETNLSAEKIADLTGFSSLAYLSNVFRREEGITLTEFRNRMTLP